MLDGCRYESKAFLAVAAAQKHDNGNFPRSQLADYEKVAGQNVGLGKAEASKFVADEGISSSVVNRELWLRRGAVGLHKGRQALAQKAQVFRARAVEGQGNAAI